MRTLFYPPSVSSIDDKDAKDPSVSASDSEEEMLSAVVLDPDTMGQELCGGIIGSLGTVCIKSASKCSVAAHKHKVEISVQPCM